MDGKMTRVLCMRLYVGLQFLSIYVVGLGDPGNVTQDMQQFLHFIHKYSKPYKVGGSEFQHRFHVFQDSLHRHRKLNRGQKSRNMVYGVTKFSDLTPDEYRELYLSRIDDHPLQRNKESNGYKETKSVPFQKDLPKKVDWREKGVISPVKNQLSCGACWAFSTVETVESMYSLKTKNPVPQLSVQEVIDCAAGNFGCNGGDTCAALQWMVKTGTPLVEDSLYPLTDRSQFCKILTNGTVGVVVKNSTCNKVIYEDEIQMLNLLAYVGPVTVSVDATTWNDYMGGIIQYHCRGPQNNHAVQIVGYDLTGEIPYYIVRNSWGTDFGHAGYLYIKYGANVCGIAREVSTVEV